MQKKSFKEYLIFDIEQKTKINSLKRLWITVEECYFLYGSTVTACYFNKNNPPAQICHILETKSLEKTCEEVLFLEAF